MTGRVPLWYHRGYSLGHVSSELRRNGYSEEEAAHRVVAYAEWLRRQEEGPEGRPTG